MACSRTRTPLTSEAGRSACLRLVATELPTASQREKQVAYRTCLEDIDEKLNKSKLTELAIKEQEEADKHSKEALERQGWASSQERILHCKMNQEEVIALNKRYTRVYAKLVNSNNKINPDASGKDDLQRELDAIEGEIRALIPDRMRAGKQLIPDALQIFRTCDPEKLITSS